MKKEIELGDRVKDIITGLSGIVFGVTNWLYGCRRIAVLPEASKDGKPADLFTIDEPQLKILKKGVVKPPKDAATKEPVRKHGPRPDPDIVGYRRSFR